LTKRELVIQVASKLGMTQNEVADIVQTMFGTITETLVEGNRLEIRNFGVFEVKARDSRVGRNPRTGVEVPIPEKRVASFKPGKVLKDWVQNGSGQPRPLFKSEQNDARGGNHSNSSVSKESAEVNSEQRSLF
jgi:nucleoid DNA-binding protein